MTNKLESLQKNCIKWILSEEFLSYSSLDIYIQKCLQVNLLPLAKRFELNDLILFHKIYYNLIPIDLPDYLSEYNENSRYRLRSSHLDSLSIVCNLEAARLSEVYLKKSFFYRTHTEWNALPLEIRQTTCPFSFKREVIKHLWKSVLEELNDSDEEIDLPDND